ncbi:hypothetical protein TNCV_3270221 [Trichonephila clavipes]|uniref:Uncharacterized protein n=1 Tax=Trichonephila clavipes TaxID=2585209 RepID=A0A8X6VGG7_TRICX|nr:hypothetical protein TNCV_3270221 [Trichonephila clavipes]
MTLADCRRPLFACRMTYRSSPAVVILGRPPPTFLTAVPVVWNAFQAHETTLLLIPNSAATLMTPAGWCSWFVAGLVRPSLWVRILPKSVDFHNAENQQWPCRMIMQNVKDSLSACLAWVLSAKLNS